jgi:hypothetical protein
VAKKTKIFSLMPWIGGINTSLDPATIPSNQLTRANNVVFGTRGSRTKRDGINYDWDSASNSTESVIGLHEFWYGTSAGKTQKLVGVTDGKKIYSYATTGTPGTRSADLFAGTAWSSAVTNCSMVSGNNLCVIAVDGSGNVMKKWTGSGNVADLGHNTASGTFTSGNPTITSVSSFTGAVVGASITGTAIPANTTITAISTTTITMSNNANNNGVFGINYIVTPPQASLVGQHQGRMWCNDKTNVDRIHYSPISNPEVWQGLGDSGAIDIGVGDGDPEGITAFWSFKGILFVAKRTKLYKISGFSPEEYQVELVSSGVGCISHNSVAYIDQDDVFFVSEKGVHSLVATDTYGDFQGSYVSADIQQTFNEDFQRNRLKYCWAAYINNLNSVAFAFSDNQVSQDENNAIWLYNIPLKSWYTWPNVSCESLITVSDEDQRRIYVGTSTTRVAKTENGTNYDVNTSGNNTALTFTAKTGVIFVDGDPYTVKAFKKLSLVYRPNGASTVTALVKIDNYPLQSIAFTESGSSDLLGSSFVLGSSVLSSEPVLAPYTQSIDGYGRGIQITFEQSGTDEAIEIQGFAIEYEVMGVQQEVVLNQSAS